METRVDRELNKLDYSLPKTRRRERWVVIAVLTALIFALPMFIGMKWVAVSWRHKLQAMSAQQRCLAFAQAPGTVVYDEEPTTAAKLVGGKGTVRGCAITETQQGAVLGCNRIAPDCFQQIVSNAHQSGINSLPSFPDSDFSPFVYLGNRSTRSGPKRLVYLSLNSAFGQMRLGSQGELEAGALDVRSVLNWAVIQPATWSSPVKVLKTGTWEDQNLRINMPWPLRVDAGQSDPNDTSRFVIPYRTPEGAFVVDAQLLPNDQINFSTRVVSPTDGPTP